MVNKIYITGPVGSGKSTLARNFSKKHGFVCCELDSVVYEPDSASSSGNRKRSDEARDSLLNEILANKWWVIEDAGREIFEHVWQKADSIILLKPPIYIRKYRILARWIKQNLRLEKCGYTPNFVMLRLMFKWTRNFDIGVDGVKERLKPYISKITVIKTKNYIADYTKKHLTI